MYDKFHHHIGCFTVDSRQSYPERVIGVLPMIHLLGAGDHVSDGDVFRRPERIVAVSIVLKEEKEQNNLKLSDEMTDVMSKHRRI